MRKDVFVWKMLAERAVEIQNDVYVCFIDYVKASDHVREQQLVEMQEWLDPDSQHVGLINNLYWDQQASARLNVIIVIIHRVAEDLDLCKYTLCPIKTIPLNNLYWQVQTCIEFNVIEHA